MKEIKNRRYTRKVSRFKGVRGSWTGQDGNKADQEERLLTTLVRGVSWIAPRDVWGMYGRDYIGKYRWKGSVTDKFYWDKSWRAYFKKFKTKHRKRRYRLMKRLAIKRIEITERLLTGTYKDFIVEKRFNSDFQKGPREYEFPAREEPGVLSFGKDGEESLLDVMGEKPGGELKGLKIKLGEEVVGCVRWSGGLDGNLGDFLLGVKDKRKKDGAVREGERWPSEEGKLIGQDLRNKIEEDSRRIAKPGKLTGYEERFRHKRNEVREDAGKAQSMSFADGEEEVRLEVRKRVLEKREKGRMGGLLNHRHQDEAEEKEVICNKGFGVKGREKMFLCEEQKSEVGNLFGVKSTVGRKVKRLEDLGFVTEERRVEEKVVALKGGGRSLGGMRMQNSRALRDAVGVGEDFKMLGEERYKKKGRVGSVFRNLDKKYTLRLVNGISDYLRLSDRRWDSIAQRPGGGRYHHMVAQTNLVRGGKGLWQGWRQGARGNKNEVDHYGGVKFEVVKRVDNFLKIYTKIGEGLVLGGIVGYTRIFGKEALKNIGVEWRKVQRAMSHLRAKDRQRKRGHVEIGQGRKEIGKAVKGGGKAFPKPYLNHLKGTERHHLTGLPVSGSRGTQTDVKGRRKGYGGLAGIRWDGYVVEGLGIHDADQEFRRREFTFGREVKDSAKSLTVGIGDLGIVGVVIRSSESGLKLDENVFSGAVLYGDGVFDFRRERRDPLISHKKIVVKELKGIGRAKQVKKVVEKYMKETESRVCYPDYLTGLQTRSEAHVVYKGVKDWLLNGGVEFCLEFVAEKIGESWVGPGERRPLFKSKAESRIKILNINEEVLQREYLLVLLLSNHRTYNRDVVGIFEEVGEKEYGGNEDRGIVRLGEFFFKDLFRELPNLVDRRLKLTNEDDYRERIQRFSYYSVVDPKFARKLRGFSPAFRQVCRRMRMIEVIWWYGGARLHNGSYEYVLDNFKAGAEFLGPGSLRKSKEVRVFEEGMFKIRSDLAPEELGQEYCFNDLNLKEQFTLGDLLHKRWGLPFFEKGRETQVLFEKILSSERTEEEKIFERFDQGFFVRESDSRRFESDWEENTREEDDWEEE